MAKTTPDPTEKLIKAVADKVYLERRAKRQLPEGEFDEQGRWWPSEREAAGDMVVSPPSRDHRFRFLLRCRSKAHCELLVRRCFQFKDVPDDVRAAVKKGTHRDDKQA